MKKTLYHNKSKEELESEIASLRTALHTARLSREGKNTSSYRTTRKNIARALTALRAVGIQTVNSTKSEK